MSVAGAPKRTVIRAAFLGALLIAIVVAIVTAVGAAAVKLRSGRLIELSRVETERYAALLTSELHRFDYLPDLLEYHPSVTAVLRAPNDPERVDAANRYLESVNRVAGTTALYLLDLKGVVLAASNWNQPISFVGVDLSYRPYVQRSLKTGSDRFYGIGTTSGTPGYYFATVLPRQGSQLGIGVVKVNLERVEAQPSTAVGDVMITDQNGVIVLSSRPQWRYRTLEQLPADVLNDLRSARQYDNVALTPVGLRTEETLADGAAIVSLAGDGPDAKRMRFLAETQRLDGSDWKITILSNLSDVTLFKHWAQLAATLIAIAIFLSVLLIAQRRRVIRLELAAKEILARANIELEKKVTERTQDLVATNQQLRAAQDELVHGAKLAAIGQFAAGVTHELSQPLAAIRTLSDNAGLLLERSQPATALANLRMIGELVDRIIGIASQLKLFARKDSMTLQPVSVKQSIANSLRILDGKIARIGCQVDVSLEDGDLTVNADHGRLDQVFVNLIGNALDAVSGVANPRVQIAAREVDATIVISIADDGPGLTAEALTRLFEPFFTTKSAGEGLGLGLSISEGMVRQFGGALRASNGLRQGAEFVVTLPTYRMTPEVAHA